MLIDTEVFVCRSVSPEFLRSFLFLSKRRLSEAKSATRGIFMTLLDKEVFPGIRLSLLIPPPQRALFCLTFTLTLSLEGQGKARDREQIQRALSSALLRLATVLIDNWRHRLLQLLLQAYKSQLQHMLEFGPLIAHSAPSLAYLTVGGLSSVCQLAILSTISLCFLFPHTL